VSQQPCERGSPGHPTAFRTWCGFLDHFTMGSDHHYAERQPTASPWTDSGSTYPVTNERFARFVAATSDHVRGGPPTPLSTEALRTCFTQARWSSLSRRGPVDLRNMANWWSFMRVADWRHPQGSSTSIQNREQHPAVHVAFADAEAFLKWEGKLRRPKPIVCCAWRIGGAPYLGRRVVRKATWPIPGGGIPRRNLV
jgi:hypothetical protein